MGRRGDEGALSVTGLERETSARRQPAVERWNRAWLDAGM